MRALGLQLILAAMAVLGPLAAHAADTVGDCRIGTYRLADGSWVDIGAADGDVLRWRRLDGTLGALHPTASGGWTGTMGYTDHPDATTATFTPCADGGIVFDGIAGRRIAFDVTDTVFDGAGVKLAGRLVLPKGDGPVPIVVLIHGSENFSARDFYSLQRILPAQGVGVFVFDKRGTGASTGKYTQDFSILADDAVAAMREARRLAGARAGRVGYQGGSQGGWIAPMAADRAPVDFVIVGFGLAVTVLEEDHSEAALEMKLKGHSSDEIAKALEVVDAADDVFASNYTSGFERFDAVRAKYRNEPWYKDIHGNFAYMILPYDAAQIREVGSKSFNFGTPWRYDPMPVLRRATAPELWMLGTDDLEAPSAETSRRIAALGAEGRPFTLAMFPRSEHGIFQYEIKADGERDDTRNADGYYAMIADFARDGRLHGSYGDSAVTAPR